MQVLWDLQSATVADVVSRLKSNYSTVQTMLRILETKGYVAHEKAGRAFTYRPLIDQTQARRRALSHLVSGLFNNSPSLLVLNVLEDERHRSARARPAPPVNHGERIVESALPALVNWLWQGSAIALAATAILRPSRRISATTRYQLWWIALFIVLALPILSFLLASFQLPARACNLACARVRRGRGGRPVPGSASWELEAGSWELPSAWTGALLAFLWLAIAAVSLSRTALALIALRRVKRTARPFPEACEARLHTWLLLRSLGRPAQAGGFGSHPCGGGARSDLAFDRGRPADARGARRPRARSDRRARVGARATTRRSGAPRTADHRRFRRPPSRGLVDRSSAASRARDRLRRLGRASDRVRQEPCGLPDQTRRAAGPTVTFGAGPGGARVFAADRASRPAARSTPQHVDHADVRSADARRARPGCAGADRCERGARGDVTCYPGCPGRRDVGPDERRLIGRRDSDRRVSARAADRSKRIASTRAAKRLGLRRKLLPKVLRRAGRRARRRLQRVPSSRSIRETSRPRTSLLARLARAR